MKIGYARVRPKNRTWRCRSRQLKAAGCKIIIEDQVCQARRLPGLASRMSWHG